MRLQSHLLSRITLMAAATAMPVLMSTPAGAWPPPPPPGLTDAQNSFTAFQKSDGAVVQNATANTVISPDGSTTTTVAVVYSDGTFTSTATTTYKNGTTSVNQTQGGGLGIVDSVTTVKNAQGQITKVTDAVHGSVVQTTSYTYYPDGQLSGETIVTSGPNGKGTGTTEITTWNDTKGGTQPFGQHDQIITGGSLDTGDFAIKGLGNDFPGKHHDSLKSDSGGLHELGAANHDDRVPSLEQGHGTGVKIDDDIPLDETPSASKAISEQALELKTGGGASAPTSSPVFNPINLNKLTTSPDGNGGTRGPGKLTGASLNTPTHTVHSVEGATRTSITTVTPSLVPSLPTNNLR